MPMGTSKAIISIHINDVVEEIITAFVDDGKKCEKPGSIKGMKSDSNCFNE